MLFVSKLFFKDRKLFIVASSLLSVDGKMEEIKASGIDDSQQLRIAILAAMNITDELFAYKKEKKKFVDKVEAKTIAITEFIENRIHDIEESNN